METLAWVTILAGILIGRQVIVGRAAQFPQDTHDFFLAFFRGDGAGLSEIAKRRGTSTAQNVATSLTDAQVSSMGSSGNVGSTLIAEMKRLAIAADNKYRWGATGPDGYDCSGLVWRAMKNLNLYGGPRFTTITFAASLGSKVQKVATPAPGDIVNWSLRHMGVVVGADRMYSALNTKVGITESAISAERGTPEYWRLTVSGGVGKDG